GFGAFGAHRPFAPDGSKPSMDTWFVDSNTLWSLTWNPLYPFSLALIVLVVLWVQDGFAKENDRGFFFAGALTSLLGLIHPYDVGAVCFVALATALYGKFRWRALASFSLAAAPGIVYPLYLSMKDPFLARHAAMGWMSTPGLLDVLWGFGLPG